MKILIAFYSHTGTTRLAARAIQSVTGGDLYEIKESDAYPREYQQLLKRAKQEIGAGEKPPLQGELPDMSKYDVLVIGSPNWCDTIAPPVASFLNVVKTDGKRVIPFLTHGGGGLGRSLADIQALCPSAEIADMQDANQSRQAAAKIQSAIG